MKLYTVVYSTPYQNDNEIIVESETAADAKEYFTKVLSLNAWFKTDLDGKDMIVPSATIKIKKAILYKKV